MSFAPFRNRFEDLPRLLPVFPLSGALLLPGGLMPLNIFEPRYLALVEDALGWGRLIGMIQPLAATEEESPASVAAPLYETGCAGRISQFAETEDGRLLITLTGVCRFRIAEELASSRGYRRITADWSPFKNDVADTVAPSIDRGHLLSVFKAFGRIHGMDINWKAVESASDLALTISLPMACPFEPSEKQALLECTDATERAHTLIALMEMTVAAKGGGGHNQIKQ